MTNRTGVVNLETVLEDVSHHKVRGFTMRSRKPRAGEDWFKIEDAHKGSANDETTEVYILDEIGYWGTDASEFSRLLLEIDTPKIDLHLNSPGGEFYDGVTIYNAIKAHSADVTVYVDGMAASAASFIAQAGNKIIMNEGSMMMIHDAAGITFGPAVEHHKNGDVLDKVSNIVAGLYAARAGGTTETWRAFMLEETWYNAEEAVDAGLADEVGGESSKPTNKWDLTIFNYAGRDKAPAPEEIERKITTRAKEAPVTVPVETSGETPPAGTPTLAVPPTVPPAAPVAPVTEPVTPPVEAAPVVPVDSAGVPTFMVSGAPVTDHTAVQAHITSLETAAKETQTNNRKAFVKQLSDDTKILASGMTALEEFALSLSPEQYDSWCASWNAVPKLSVLQTPPVVPPKTAVGGTEDDELDIAKGIVKQHKISGMPLNAIKETDSYKKLIAADPEYKL
jgi:ATP-dependent protease ClpP protease subunit